MNYNDFKNRTDGHIHHHAIVKTQDGSTHEGYMQPFDQERVYFTTLDGKSGGSVAIADVVDISFPEGQ